MIGDALLVLLAVAAWLIAMCLIAWPLESTERGRSLSRRVLGWIERH